MVNQRYCPFCKTAAREGCDHLAMAAPGRDFVQCCIDAAQAQLQWRALCSRIDTQSKSIARWSPDLSDFTWLETAFCSRFLLQLRWFGSMDYEWRTSMRPETSGFVVLLWSKNPQGLWWELHDEIDRQLNASHLVSTPRTGPQGELFYKFQHGIIENRVGLPQ